MDEKVSMSTQEIAHGILKELKNSGHKKFTARPWNHFKPGTTLWWLVPSAQWPSYKYGKIIIHSEKGMCGIGLNAEKGIAPIAAQMLSSGSAKKLCIGQDWIWHQLIEDAKSGKLKKVLDRISRETNRSLKIIVEASTIEDKNAHVVEFEGLELDNVISFDYHDGILSCLKDETKGAMRDYDYIDSIEKLLDIFEAKEMEWFWIDFFVLFELREPEIDESIDLAFAFIDNYSDIFI